MTRTDLLDDLADLKAEAFQDAMIARVADRVWLTREDRLILYAGANIPSERLAAAFDPALSLMPAMGPPADKEQPGADFVASLEALTARLAAEVFGSAWADCRLPSCTIANLAVFGCFAERGDLVLAPAAEDGGHLSQRRGGTPSLFGLDVIDLPFDAEEQRLDAPRTAEMIRRLRPRLVMLGRSVVLGPDDLGPVVEAARDTGTLTVYDASHVAGLIGGGAFPNPLEAGVDLVTLSTYKTLAGPTGAIAAGNDPDDGERLRSFIDGTLLANQDAARLPVLAGALAEFRDNGDYANRTVALAGALKSSLRQAGLRPLLPPAPAQSHQVVVPVGDLALTRAVVLSLERASLLVGRCPVPGMPGSHGLRFGSQLAARTGVTSTHLPELAEAIAAVIGATSDAGEALGASEPAVVRCRDAVVAVLRARRET